MAAYLARRLLQSALILVGIQIAIALLNAGAMAG